MDRGVEMTLIQVYINVQKCDFREGGVPDELDEIAAVEGVATMRPKEENVPEFGVKEILFKETHVQDCIGRVHMCAHGGSLNL